MKFGRIEAKYYQLSSKPFTMAADAEIDDVLYSKIEPYSTGMLEVSDLHTIFWERAGNPDGQPCLLYTSPSPRDVCSSRMPSSA